MLLPHQMDQMPKIPRAHANRTEDLPPRYTEQFGMPTRRRAAWDPRGWGLKTKIGAAIGLVLVILAIILAGVFGSRASSSYPDYSQLSYKLVDACTSS